MKLGQLANKEVQNLLLDLMNRKLSAKTAFKLKTLVKQVREEMIKYDEVREKMLNRYGTKDLKGKVQLSQEGMRQFGAEMAELNKVEVSITPISISEFEGIEFTGNELILLDGLIV